MRLVPTLSRQWRAFHTSPCGKPGRAALRPGGRSRANRCTQKAECVAVESDRPKPEDERAAEGAKDALSKLESSQAHTKLDDGPRRSSAAIGSYDPHDHVPVSAAAIASLGAIGGIVLLASCGYFFQDQIRAFLDYFTNAVEEYGYLGYVAYAVVYTGLEVLALPAVPLTMTAGAIFGIVPGTLIVSFSGTAAATIAFLIARYAARDRVRALAAANPKFAAIDKGISKDGFKFVTLLRLSPLLPFAASNYLYGLTSIELGPYVLGSWLGMLPGTYAYVSAGQIGKAVLSEGEGSFNFFSWHVAGGLAVTGVAIAFVGRLAKQALDEFEQEERH